MVVSAITQAGNRPRAAKVSASAAATPAGAGVSVTPKGGVCMNAALTGPPGAAHQPNSGASSPNAAGPRTRTVSVAASWTVFSAAREHKKSPAVVKYSATSPVSVQAMSYDR